MVLFCFRPRQRLRVSVGAAFQASHRVSTCSAVPNPLSPSVMRQGLHLSPLSRQVPLRSFYGTVRLYFRG